MRKQTYHPEDSLLRPAITAATPRHARRALGTAAVVTAALLTAAALLVFARPAAAQQVAATEAERPFSPDELEELVGPIALYPDDLIAVVLPASTYPLDVVEAARFLDEREADPSLAPPEDWDDSIVALLNYPEVLRLMDEDLDWTWSLGEAFLTQQAEVFDAIQRFREQAREAGNLASNERQIVRQDEGVIEIAPADPKVIYVPYYEPRRVIVHHHSPIYYYPRPYPVYYYPYPAGYSFHSGFFWGVTTAFVIGWNTHFLHAHHYLHVGHPYYSYRYYDPFYVRRSINVNIVSVNRVGYVWRPAVRHGARPARVAVTRREGRARNDYPVTRSYEGRTDTRSYAESRTVERAARPANEGTTRLRTDRTARSTVDRAAPSAASRAAPSAADRSAPDRAARAALERVGQAERAASQARSPTSASRTRAPRATTAARSSGTIGAVRQGAQSRAPASGTPASRESSSGTTSRGTTSRGTQPAANAYAARNPRVAAAQRSQSSGASRDAGRTTGSAPSAASRSTGATSRAAGPASSAPARAAGAARSTPTRAAGSTRAGASRSVEAAAGNRAAAGSRAAGGSARAGRR